MIRVISSPSISTTGLSTLIRVLVEAKEFFEDTKLESKILSKNREYVPLRLETQTLEAALKTGVWLTELARAKIEADNLMRFTFDIMAIRGIEMMICTFQVQVGEIQIFINKSYKKC